MVVIQEIVAAEARLLDGAEECGVVVSNDSGSNPNPRTKFL